MKTQTFKNLVIFGLVASLVAGPMTGFAKNDKKDKKDDDNKPKKTLVVKMECSFRAFGHLIAPGWLSKNATSTTNVSLDCGLPFGIAKKLGFTKPPKPPVPPATTTPPGGTDTTAPFMFLVDTNTGTTTASIRWFTNERSDSQIVYGTTTAYGNSTTIDTTLRFLHSMTLTGLQSDAVYHFQVKSRDAAGNLAVSSDHTFKTKKVPDEVAPVISQVAVSAISSNSASVSWNTNEPAKSKVYFAQGSTVDLGSANAVSNSSLVLNHSLVISSLAAGTTNSFVIESEDASGNKATSSLGIFVTLP